MFCSKKKKMKNEKEYKSYISALIHKIIKWTVATTVWRRDKNGSLDLIGSLLILPMNIPVEIKKIKRYTPRRAKYEAIQSNLYKNL